MRGKEGNGFQARAGGALLLLAALTSPLQAQGALSLLERSSLVVEGRLLGGKVRGNPPYRLFRVTRVLLGRPPGPRIPLLDLSRVSAHLRPITGKEYLLFLAPLPPGRAPRRTFLVLQSPSGAVALDERGGRDFARLAAALAARLHSPVKLAGLLLEALGSPSPRVVSSAALDLETHRNLLPLLGPAGGRVLLERFRRLGPAGPWARPLAHVLGEIRPAGWAEALAAMLRAPGGAAFAVTVGRILGARLGARSVEILERGARQGRNPGAPPPPAHLLALGATERREALSLLRGYLEEEGAFQGALSALALSRSWRAARILGEVLTQEEEGEGRGDRGEKRKKAVLKALARMGTRPARNLLEEIASGKRAPELSREAARLLGR